MTRKSQKSAKKHPEYITERIKINTLIPGGQAITTLSTGQKIMLWNALPGETVTRVAITKRKSTYLEGIVEEVLNPSPHRVEPKDSCFLSTSPWQIMDYDYELLQKQILLAEIFRQHQLELPAETPAVQTDGRSYHYRNKMEYSLYYDHADGLIKPAFHQRGSHRKIPITTSSLEHPAIFQRMQEIIADLNAQHANARDYQSLLLRCDQTGNVSGGLYTKFQSHPDFPPLQDNIFGVEYFYSPNGFFQINLPVYELALKNIRQHISTTKVLDLYSGVGTIGLSVAAGKDLILVESDKSAYRELERNLQSIMHQKDTIQLSTIKSQDQTTKPRSARSFLTKSETALEYIAPDQTVTVDPPRAGCHPDLINRLLEVLPPTIIYLSCNPATQARDVKMLESKYHITSVTPYNFFPRTPHLENLIILEQK